MAIYFLTLEAVPKRSNPESKEFGGAFINCLVKADTPEDALITAIKYVDEENWIFVRIEDIYIAQRHLFLDYPDTLEDFDNACEYGLGATFYTWPID